MSHARHVAAHDQASGTGRYSAPSARSIKLVEHTTASAYQEAFPGEDVGEWKRAVPQVEVVRIRSSLDRKAQRAMWYHSGSSGLKPLLVVLHSWSARYDQTLNIPFAEIAIANDWVFIQPDFRGPNLRPEAAASRLAIQDVLDAVKYAESHARVDARRVYLVGYSGGGMKALILAGQFPQAWAGVVAWGAIYDVPDWYQHNRNNNDHYAKSIVAACGGVPRPGTKAEAECRRRSPMSHVQGAAGRVPILLVHGIRDTTVPVRHALLTFDRLAAAPQRFGDSQMSRIDSEMTVPPDLRGGGNQGGALERLFEQSGLPPLLVRRSQTVTLVIYDGHHDMAYNPTADWLSGQRKQM